MTDKTTPEGFSKAKTTTEGFSKRQANEDDVEGHGFRHATDGFSKAKVEGEGFARAKATGDDDVAGHGFQRVSPDPDGFSKAKVDGEGFARAKATEDDVEGHSILDPFAARELARARERDVQQHAKRHEFERDARDAKKDRS
jgi:hypothetical protein